MVWINTEVEVDVDLDDFDEDELIEHLELNGYKVIKEDEQVVSPEIKETLNRLADLYRSNQTQFLEEVRVYLMDATDRILP